MFFLCFGRLLLIAEVLPERGGVALIVRVLLIARMLLRVVNCWGIVIARSVVLLISGVL